MSSYFIKVDRKTFCLVEKENLREDFSLPKGSILEVTFDQIHSCFFTENNKRINCFDYIDFTGELKLLQKVNYLYIFEVLENLILDTNTAILTSIDINLIENTIEEKYILDELKYNKSIYYAHITLSFEIPKKDTFNWKDIDYTISFEDNEEKIKFNFSPFLLKTKFFELTYFVFTCEDFKVSIELYFMVKKEVMIKCFRYIE